MEFPPPLGSVALQPGSLSLDPGPAPGPHPAPGPDPAQLWQLILPTDKRNPSFPLYRMIDKAYAWKL